MAISRQLLHQSGLLNPVGPSPNNTMPWYGGGSIVPPTYTPPTGGGNPITYPVLEPQLRDNIQQIPGGPPSLQNFPGNHFMGPGVYGVSATGAAANPNSDPNILLPSYTPPLKDQIAPTQPPSLQNYPPPGGFDTGGVISMPGNATPPKVGPQTTSSRPPPPQGQSPLLAALGGFGGGIPGLAMGGAIPYGGFNPTSQANPMSAQNIANAANAYVTYGSGGSL